MSKELRAGGSGRGGTEGAKPPCYDLLGVRVHLMTAGDLHRRAEDAIRGGESHVFAGHNLHSVHLYHRDAEMRRFYAMSRYVFVDGMPLVWLGKAAGRPMEREHRNTPVDWFPQLLGTAAREGWRVFYLGSAPGVAAKGADRLRQRWPGLQIETEHGYFDMEPGSREAEEVLARIRAYRPHILGVGMGMPRQEHWIARYGERTGANVIVSLGALMDLIAGELPLPPRWIGRSGLEWLYRLCTRPQQVWRRYLVEPWTLVPWAARDVFGRRAPALTESPEVAENHRQVGSAQV